MRTFLLPMYLEPISKATTSLSKGKHDRSIGFWICVRGRGTDGPPHGHVSTGEQGAFARCLHRDRVEGRFSLDPAPSCRTSESHAMVVLYTPCRRSRTLTRYFCEYLTSPVE